MRCFRLSLALILLLGSLGMSLGIVGAAVARADEVAKQDGAQPSSKKRTEKQEQQEKFFESRVHPILARRCYECHAAETQEGGLRLDGRAFVLAGVDGRPAAVPGKPNDSSLVAAVRRRGEIKMPPDDPLPADELETLVAWIKMGLPWAAGSGNRAAALTREQQFDQQRQSHWAYQPITRPTQPTVTDAAWPRRGLDWYVLHELEADGITPSVQADRRTLIRRATFDLLGLPPTTDEVDAFVTDSRPDAYTRLIDRLLGSPHYGERWGRHWLDLARYADTKGYSFGRERRYPYSYTYRDYVIRSLNEDLPYDRFLLEQLAADQLPIEPDSPSLAALGFLTVGRKFNNRHDDIDDQIDVVSRGLMGLTVSCARCHDHKYDAIPTQDYYSLYGVFASSTEPSDLPLIGDPNEIRGYQAFKQELDKRQAALDAKRNERLAALVDHARTQVTEYIVRATSSQPEDLLRKLPFVSLSKDELKTRLIDAWRKYIGRPAHKQDTVWGPLHEASRLSHQQFRDTAKQWLDRTLQRESGTDRGQLNPRLREAIEANPPESQAELARLYGVELRAAYEAWKAAGGNDTGLASLPVETRQLAEALVTIENPTKLGLEQLKGYVTRAERNKLRELQKRIDSHQVNSPGAPPRAMVVREGSQPHNPRVFIRGNQARRGNPVPRQFLYVLSGPQRKPFRQGGGRLELAKEIASADNPLTRRVMVNRVWMQHFGEPLVTTPSDFGIRTDAPRHRKLLDYLSWSFEKHGWSLKALHREIMLSSTYRQASVSRPDAENRDPENRLLWRMNRRRLEFEPLRDALFAVADRLDTTLGGRPVDLFKRPYAPRRAVYGFIDRQDLPNLLRVFDFASPDQSSARRPQTTVPQQALFLMNSPLVIQQARSLIARTEIQQAPEAGRRIDRLYRLLFARPATQREIEVGRRFVQATASSAGSELGPWQQYAQLLLLSNEFLFVD